MMRMSQRIERSQN
jgi:hypothetical protein